MAPTKSRTPEPDQGRGGALLREKIVAAASHRMIVIADDSKWVSRARRVPAADRGHPVRLFGDIAGGGEGDGRRPAAGGPLTLRKGKDGHAFVTDGGHWIIDAALGRIDDPKALAHALANVPGVMEHGLFVGMASIVILSGAGWHQGRRTVLIAEANRTELR